WPSGPARTRTAGASDRPRIPAAPLFRAMVLNKLSALMGPPALAPEDVSAPHELSEALSIWSREAAHAASRGARAAAYAMEQADVARSTATQARDMLGEIQESPCFAHADPSTTPPDASLAGLGGRASLPALALVGCRLAQRRQARPHWRRRVRRAWRHAHGAFL
ncbi:unnamed protein product, partial [Prorocentrum cordatum]